MEFEDIYQNPKQNMYTVEKILKKRTISKGGQTKIMYFVKWYGYSHEENTWQPEENLETVPQVIEKFEKLLAEKSRNVGYSQSINRGQEQKRETIKGRSRDIDPQQSNSKSQGRFHQDNGNKVKKIQEAPSRSTEITTKSQPKKDDGLPLWNSRKPSRREKPSEATEQSATKKVSIIEVQDSPSLAKQSISKEKVAEKPKLQKNAQLFGRIVNHHYRDGQLFYEIQKLAGDNRVRKIEQLPRQQVEKSCLREAYEYLSKLLVSLEERRN